MGSAARQEAQREGWERPGVQGWVLRLGPSHALQTAPDPESLRRRVSLQLACLDRREAGPGVPLAKTQARKPYQKSNEFTKI